MEAALNIRQNAQEYQDFVKDLNTWKNKVTNSSNSTFTVDHSNNVEKVDTMKDTIKDKVKDKIKAYDYRAWDKYNVEEACNQVDEEIHKSNGPFIDTTNSTTDSSNMEVALIEKEKGNVYFKKELYKKALNCYTKSLSLVQDDKVYSNRALCWIKLDCWQEAEKDSTFALNFNPKNVKALWRRGISKRELGKLKESKLDLQYALVLEPSNHSIKQELEKVELALKGKVDGKLTSLIKSNVEESPEVHDLQVLDKGIKEMNVKDSTFTRKDSKDLKERPIRRRILIQEYNSSPLSSTVSRQDSSTPTPPAPTPTPTTSMYSIKEAKEEEIQEIKTIIGKNMELKPPSNLFEFESEFKNLKNDLLKLYEYFKLISPNSFINLYKNSFEEVYLIAWIQVLLHCFIKNQEFNQVLEILNHLRMIPRFKTILLFLSNTVKQELKDIFKSLESQNIEKEILKEIKLIYKV